jgi:hypothetical protein
VCCAARKRPAVTLTKPSKPSDAPDRKRLAELIALAEAGDAAALRAYSIKTYYSAAVERDRFRHRAILACRLALNWGLIHSWCTRRPQHTR